MPAHVWSSLTDFEYCTSSNCEYVSGSVRLSGSSGTVTTDIRDSTSRVFSYNEMQISDSIPSGSDITYYWRSGRIPVYDANFWNDWQEVDPTTIYTEFTISLLDDRVNTDYSIDELVYVGIEEYWRTGQKYIGSCRIGSAIIGTSRIGRAGDIADVSDGCIVSDQLINITNTEYVFDDNRVNVVVRYVPEYPLLGVGDRYFQLRADLTSAVSGSIPSISEIGVNYRMDAQYLMERAFPLFYRRV